MNDYRETPWMDRLMTAGIVSVMLVVGWAGIRNMEKNRPATMAAADVVEAARQRMAAPPGAAQPVAPNRAVVAADVDTVTMFECQKNGQSVLSERPCGAAAATPRPDNGRLQD
jgi:hypothetical protein